MSPMTHRFILMLSLCALTACESTDAAMRVRHARMRRRPTRIIVSPIIEAVWAVFASRPTATPVP